MSERGIRAAHLASPLTALAVAGILGCHSPERTSQASYVDELADAGVVAWCAEGAAPIAGGGCLAVPDGVAASVPLVIYLHGMYEKSSPAEELDRQRRVVARALANKYAVLALRSTEGACHPTVAEYAGRYCWPSNEEVADHAVAFVDGWRPALAVTERRIGKGKRFVLGFSSGAFFAGLLAVRGEFAADAFALAHGGPVEPIAARPTMPPLLLLSADADQAQEGMVRLDQELTREHWPHDEYARGGGHALPDSDIDLALAFFARSGEPEPLQPPLSQHRPQGRPREVAQSAASSPLPEQSRETAQASASSSPVVLHPRELVPASAPATVPENPK